MLHFCLHLTARNCASLRASAVCHEMKQQVQQQKLPTKSLKRKGGPLISKHQWLNGSKYHYRLLINPTEFVGLFGDCVSFKITQMYSF